MNNIIHRYNLLLYLSGLLSDPAFIKDKIKSVLYWYKEWTKVSNREPDVLDKDFQKTLYERVRKVFPTYAPDLRSDNTRLLKYFSDTVSQDIKDANIATSTEFMHDSFKFLKFSLGELKKLIDERL